MIMRSYCSWCRFVVQHLYSVTGGWMEEQLNQQRLHLFGQYFLRDSPKPPSPSQSSPKRSHRTRKRGSSSHFGHVFPSLDSRMVLLSQQHPCWLSLHPTGPVTCCITDLFLHTHVSLQYCLMLVACFSHQPRYL